MSDERTDAPSRTRGLMPAWRKGESGNPGGKPVGTRNRLQGDFVRELADDFETFGRVAIEECRTSEPAKYLQIIASLMPKDVHVSAQPLAELTETELAHAIGLIQRYIDAGAPAIGGGATIEGEATRLVPSLPEADGVPRGGEDVPRAAADGCEPGGEDPERGR